MKLISVDGGTTNTRLTLTGDGRVIDTFKVRIGAGSADRNGKQNPYIIPLRDGLRELLQANRLNEGDIAGVVLSGMICSETGVWNVPHISAPADAKKTACAIDKRQMPEITNIPLCFIPGVRTDGEDFSTLDIMRGEETELFGICGKMNIENFIAVMPGSHTKIVWIGKGGTIQSFRTSLTGELIRAAAEHTILRTALYDVFPNELDEISLDAGLDYCTAHGLNEALFKVRVQQKFTSKTPEQLFAFLCGACLHADVQNIKKEANSLPVYVGGSNPFRAAYVRLLTLDGNCSVFEIPSSLADHAAAYGANELFGYI